VNLATGHSRRDAYSFKSDFLMRAVAHALARVKQMSNNANSQGFAIGRSGPMSRIPRMRQT
jgi:hypothetical protein